MSELVVYSTGVTVPSAWLNSALLREEGLASYVVYSVSGTVYAKALVPAGTNYSGTDGVNGTTAISNAIVAMSAGQKILFRQGTYSITAQIPCAKDIRIECEPGVTFKWTGSAPVANTAIFVNSASINLTWDGGTIDQNAVNNVFGIGFGSSIGTNPSFALKSAVIRNLNIINVHVDGLLMNHVLNTDVKLIDVFVQKEATGTSGDLTELTGTRCDCVRVKLDLASIGASGITSAYLRDSVWDVEALNSTNAAGTPIIGLQAFTSGSVSSPYFDNVDIYCRNGHVVLNNGNITTNVIAGSHIRIHGRQSTFFQIGTNGGGASGGGELWNYITVDGQWNITSQPCSISSCNGLTLDVDMEGKNSTLSGVNGLFYCTATNAMDRVNDNFVVKHFNAHSFTSAMIGAWFWANGSGNQKVANFFLMGGDVSNNASQPLNGFYSATGIGSTLLTTRNVKGYNPQTASNVTAGTSPWTYTNTDGFDETMILNNLNGGSISAISYKGDAGYPTTVNGFSFFLQPNQTITVTWATTAPTFRKYPQ